jgi:hypothetical protein
MCETFVCVVLAALREGDRLTPFRYTVKPEDMVTHYYPDVLDLSDGDKTMAVRPTQIGAVFHGNYGCLPSIHGSVIWEVSHSADTRCMVSPLKPKFFTTCKATLQKGRYYVVT